MGSFLLRAPRPHNLGDTFTSQWLINPLIQTELVHLCAGPSGSGKTRWLIDTIQNRWRLGKEVLGHRSYPVPWAYVPMDRPYSSVVETLLRLDIDPDFINIIPAMDYGYKSINPILDDAKHMGAKLIFIEMFSFLLEGPETKESVKEFMGAAQRALASTGMTIIGTMESPKMKPRDVYRNPRQRISGPASWGHCAETIILVEPDPRKPENSPYRTISIHTRNDMPEIFPAKFDATGRLRIIPPSKAKSATLTGE